MISSIYWIRIWCDRTDATYVLQHWGFSLCWIIKYGDCSNNYKESTNDNSPKNKKTLIFIKLFIICLSMHMASKTVIRCHTNTFMKVVVYVEFQIICLFAYTKLSHMSMLQLLFINMRNCIHFQHFEINQYKTFCLEFFWYGFSYTRSVYDSSSWGAFSITEDWI